VRGKPVDSPLPDAVDVSVRATRHEPGAIDLTLDGTVPPGSALIVSENYYPGWTAVVDGQSAPIARVDLSLIGIELPDGAQRVSLRFDSAPYRSGKLITLSALVLAIILVVGGSLLDRRPAPTPSL
jgi:hypothetical protein